MVLVEMVALQEALPQHVETPKEPVVLQAALPEPVEMPNEPVVLQTALPEPVEEMLVLEPVEVPVGLQAVMPEDEIDILGPHTLRIDKEEDGVRGLKRLVYFASQIAILESEERRLRKLYDQQPLDSLHDQISQVYTKKWDMKAKHSRTLDSLRETGRRRAKRSRYEALMALPFPRPRKQVKTGLNTEPKTEPKMELQELKAC
jgi:hypothetical protein